MLWRHLISKLWPAHCVYCHRCCSHDFDLCELCWRALPRLNLSCPRCALPIAGIELHCGRCLSQPLAIDSVYAPFIYDGIIAELISRAKFSPNPTIAQLLGTLWIHQHKLLAQAVPTATLIPIPLHRYRLAQRGFNQAHEIAKAIQKHISLPLNRHTLIKQHSSHNQLGNNRQQRLVNLRDAFSINTPVPAHVILIDDVMTTGSTLHHAALTLKRHGAQRVDAWIIARAQ